MGKSSGASEAFNPPLFLEVAERWDVHLRFRQEEVCDGFRDED
jgi:hypothetical protein